MTTEEFINVFRDFSELHPLLTVDIDTISDYADRAETITYGELMMELHNDFGVTDDRATSTEEDY